MKNRNKILTVIIILWTVVFDALRDCFIGEGWWKRHIFKWLAFYPLPGFVAYHFLGIWGAVIMAPVSWIAWQLSMRYLGGKDWESMWIRLIRNLFK